ncbi:hypothetical protein ACFE04_013198 [Oxalis oulophora]
MGSFSSSGWQIWQLIRLEKRRLTILTSTLTLFCLAIFVAIFSSSIWIDTTHYSKFALDNSSVELNKIKPDRPKRIEIPINCTTFTTHNQTCPTNYPKEYYEYTSSNQTCPNYFRWIHEDLNPWRNPEGITREMLERGKKTAHLRIVIVNGRVYVDKYKDSIQSRARFTLWGILQLLRRYPGRLPDLEMMFDCDDRPVVLSKYYNSAVMKPPPLFRYCSDRWSKDIVFPDWSFWGWAEINIKPWSSVLKDIREGNKETKWMEREPYAYWKGNPFVAETRQDLLKCNASATDDWNARLYIQDWVRESEHGFEHSDVSRQCNHRYKIYIEGYAWSVSEKYILACDSPTLMVTPHYHDFFTRSLQPVHHYWPIRKTDKCKSIKFAVDWGNNHKKKAQEIGRASSQFMQEELKMDYVYDYMFHLLNEYAKLLKFKPEIPEGATEVCSESMACNAYGFKGLEKKFMMESLEKGPSIESPCDLPPPYEPNLLRAFYARQVKSIRNVEQWENTYFGKQNN